MYCGVICYIVVCLKESLYNLEVLICFCFIFGYLLLDVRIQDIFREIVLDYDRMVVIVEEVMKVFG